MVVSCYLEDLWQVVTVPNEEQNVMIIICILRAKYGVQTMDIYL